MSYNFRCLKLDLILTFFQKVTFRIKTHLIDFATIYPIQYIKNIIRFYQFLLFEMTKQLCFRKMLEHNFFLIFQIDLHGCDRLILFSQWKTNSEFNVLNIPHRIYNLKMKFFSIVQQYCKRLLSIFVIIFHNGTQTHQFCFQRTYHGCIVAII